MPPAGAGRGANSFTRLRITLRPSRILAIYLLSIHLAAIAAIWFSAVPFWVGGMLSLALFFSLQRSLASHWWRGERELIYGDGRWRLVDGDESQDLQLVGESFIHPWLTILRFKSDRGRMVLPLPLDGADPAQLKQLRRILRFGLEPGPADFSRR